MLPRPLVRKRVLIVAHLFPPAGGGGVQRTLGFVRYLPEHDWTPTVVASTADDYWARDETLLEGLQATVVRVPPPPWDRARRWGRRLMLPRLRRAYDRAFVPDPRVAWTLPALSAASRLHQAAGFDVVYSSGAPWTSHLVAERFSRRTGVPWVADFRDPWTDNPLEPVAPPLRPVHRRLEARVHRTAALSIASTELYRQRMQEAFGLSPQDTLHLPNGYTESEFERLPEPGDELTLGYAGSYYGQHSPRVLFDQIDRAVARRPGLRPVVELYGMTGAVPPRRFEVRSHGYVPQREALEGLARCRAVFVTVPDLPGADGCVPQKLYVYLRLGRPILWCGPEGEATAILRRAGGVSFALDPARPDIDGLAGWLAARQSAREGADFDPEVVAAYDRRRLTATLARHLDGLARRPRSG